MKHYYYILVNYKVAGDKKKLVCFEGDLETFKKYLDDNLHNNTEIPIILIENNGRERISKMGSEKINKIEVLEEINYTVDITNEDRYYQKLCIIQLVLGEQNVGKLRKVLDILKK